LLQADLHIERVKVVFVLVTHELFVKHLGVVDFGAVLHVQQAGLFEKIAPPGSGVLLLEIAFEDVDVLIGRRQLKGLDCRWMLQLLGGEFVAQYFRTKAELPAWFQVLKQTLHKIHAAA
jgi:hypothetical protein